MSYKCRLKTANGKSLMNTGLLGVTGREPKKILTKQAVLKNVKGVLKKYDTYNYGDNNDLVDLISCMLEHNAANRISPEDILRHPFILN